MRSRALQAWFGRPDDEPRAWFLLGANLLALPGLGSFLGGHRTTGLLQAALSTAGAAMCAAWLLEFLGRWAAEGAFPLELGPRVGWALGGIATFGAAWAWALATGLALLREARARGPGGGP